MPSILEQTFGLAGKTAVVTGAARGIGQAIAELLAGCGASVVIADRDRDGGERTAAAIRQSGAQACFVQVDVGDEESVRQLFTEAQRQLGGIDILVNNAAMIGMMPLLDMPVSFFDRMQAVNVRGTFLCLREAVRVMRAGGRGGRIINISSAASLHPSIDGSTAYCASKGSVNALTRSAARECAPDKILINAVLPDAILHKDSAAQFTEHALPLPTGPATDPGRRPVGRPGEPRELAAMVAFLAGPAATYITGQSFIVDGGFFVS
jgi:gluconate 5-dehydrogenase/2-deoxy-D-gluconate 3-dehydrogenase